MGQKLAVADLDSLAVSRFRSVLLSSSLVHKPKTQHLFGTTLFQAGGGSFLSLPGNHREFLDIVTLLTELTKWMHDLMVAEDFDTQSALFAKIANRYNIFSFHADSLYRMAMYDPKTGGPNSDLLGMLDPSGKVNGLLTIRTPGASNDAAPVPGLVSVLKPLIDLHSSTELTSLDNGTGGANGATVGDTLKMLAAQGATFPASLGLAGMYNDNDIPPDYKGTDDLRLTRALGQFGTTDSDLMKAWGTAQGVGVIWNNFSIAGWLPGQTGTTILSVMDNIETNLNEIVKIINDLEQVVSLAEEVWDIISTYGPIILGLLALL